MRTLLITTMLLAVARPAAAQQEPSGDHPRLWWDAQTVDGLRARASDSQSAVGRAIGRCEDARANPGAYADGGWQGLDFSQILGDCLIAWAATESTDHADTAMVYFQVLLDDYQTVGDGAGGDDVVTHDAGYAMRSFAPYAAWAYDWLHDYPAMTEELRARARGRFKAWCDWYRESGYHPRDPGANYHAGFVFGATLIAIAQGSEGGADSAELWAFVRDAMWGEDMAGALAAGGVLVGGDWPEGWQYAPLSVAEYALAGRAMVDHGVEVPGLSEWTASLVTRHVYALTPENDGMFIGGDSSPEDVYRQPSALTLSAAVAGAAPETAREWARAELAARELEHDGEFWYFHALAEARAGAATEFPRGQTATFHVAAGTQTLYARTRWDTQAVWTAVQCLGNYYDHQFPNAGNFVLTRGGDHLIADPSPYGSLSTLTGNAPTVVSPNLPDNYQPSQGPWAERVGFDWATQTASGVIAARCDYHDTYRFQLEPTDVPYAVRDLVVLPYDDGISAAAIVVDRARTGDAGRPMHLRFRSPLSLSQAGDVVSGSGTGSLLRMTAVGRSGGTAAVRAMPVGECWDAARGQCEAARFAGDEYRLELADAAPFAVHVIDAAGANAQLDAAELVEGEGFTTLALQRGDRRFAVVWAPPGAGQLVYRAPHAYGSTHVVLDAPVGDMGRVDVSAARTGDDCEVTVTPRAGADGGFSGTPLVMAVDEDCSVLEDQEQDPFDPPPPGADGDTSGGCGCRASSPGGAATALLIISLVALVRRRAR